MRGSALMDASAGFMALFHGRRTKMLRTSRNATQMITG